MLRYLMTVLLKILESRDKTKVRKQEQEVDFKTYCRRQIIVVETRTWRDLLLSYRPPMGLAAASILVLALRTALTPALVMEIVCCSIASCIATWSFTSILSNSSIQQIPWTRCNILVHYQKNVNRHTHKQTQTDTHPPTQNNKQPTHQSTYIRTPTVMSCEKSPVKKRSSEKNAQWKISSEKRVSHKHHWTLKKITGHNWIFHIAGHFRRQIIFAYNNVQLNDGIPELSSSAPRPH